MTSSFFSQTTALQWVAETLARVMQLTVERKWNAFYWQFCQMSMDSLLNSTDCHPVAEPFTDDEWTFDRWSFPENSSWRLQVSTWTKDSREMCQITTEILPRRTQQQVSRGEWRPPFLTPKPDISPQTIITTAIQQSARSKRIVVKLPIDNQH